MASFLVSNQRMITKLFPKSKQLNFMKSYQMNKQKVFQMFEPHENWPIRKNEVYKCPGGNQFDGLPPASSEALLQACSEQSQGSRLLASTKAQEKDGFVTTNRICSLFLTFVLAWTVTRSSATPRLACSLKFGNIETY